MFGVIILVLLINALVWGGIWGLGEIVDSFENRNSTTGNQDYKSEEERKKDMRTKAIRGFYNRLDELVKNAPSHSSSKYKVSSVKQYSTSTPSTKVDLLIEKWSENQQWYYNGLATNGLWDYSDNEKVKELRHEAMYMKSQLEYAVGELDWNELRKYNEILEYYKTNEMIEAEREAKRKKEEEKRKEDAEKKRTLKNRFSYIKIEGYDAAFRYDYYSRKSYPIVDNTKERERESIWQFKNGHDEIGINVISDYLLGNFSTEEIKRLTFCVIPASTKDKNDSRYKRMCERLSEKFSIQNGFDLISILWDRPNTREKKDFDTTKNLSFSSSVKGRDIILFDDITTRGTSFTQAADILIAKGARSVRGLFLGKTV